MVSIQTSDTVFARPNGQTYVTWYTIYGDLSARGKTPLVVLHGGPGMSHDYMLSLAALAAGDDARPVIFYDQIGNAKSPCQDNEPETFWTIDLFIDELLNLVNHLNIQNSFDVLGHSWGGMLAAELIIRRQPAGLKHVILADTLYSRKRSNEVVTRHLRDSGLTPEQQEILLKARVDGDMSHPEYGAANKSFQSQFGIRGLDVNNLPEELIKSLTLGDKAGVLKAMLKHETGEDWDVTDKLNQIKIPTLIILGHYDFLADRDVCQTYLDKIQNAKLVEFMESSHVPHWEQPEAYMDAVRSFLDEGELKGLDSSISS
ncbi:hypothetical protein HYDPIDRAFT_91084 [Hydnomerulius pinastri MD-312]|uniref:AB hydrolase-1 domain-containing protein n=1 Tax=Hydnomerulius pinastri MD-312 TaxID=994086 RepID=A0A0C9VEI3_9AGAM|nr:hypothetical protein HYDPIDRAFT_91084 [Hydnomerulius pinastri MD-312]